MIIFPIPRVLTRSPTREEGKDISLALDLSDPSVLLFYSVHQLISVRLGKRGKERKTAPQIRSFLPLFSLYHLLSITRLIPQPLMGSASAPVKPCKSIPIIQQGKVKAREGGRRKNNVRVAGINVE